MSVCRLPRGCGKTILWGVDEKGRRIPLDPHAPVYHVMSFNAATQTYAVERAGGERPINYVSHFATCPKANEFSSSKQKDRLDPKSRAAGD